MSLLLSSSPPLFFSSSPSLLVYVWWCVVQVWRLGRQARRIIEEGRAHLLRSLGYIVTIHEYVPWSITPDNLLIVAQWPQAVTHKPPCPIAETETGTEIETVAMGDEATDEATRRRKEEEEEEEEEVQQQLLAPCGGHSKHSDTTCDVTWVPREGVILHLNSAGHSSLTRRMVGYILEKRGLALLVLEEEKRKKRGLALLVLEERRRNAQRTVQCTAPTDDSTTGTAASAASAASHLSTYVKLRKRDGRETERWERDREMGERQRE